MLEKSKIYEIMREKKQQTMNLIGFSRLWVGVKCFIGSVDGSIASNSPTSSRAEFVCSSPLTRTQWTNNHCK